MKTNHAYHADTAKILARLSDYVYTDARDAIAGALYLGADRAHFVERDETETLIGAFGQDVFVTWRGTEPGTLRDLLTDARVVLCSTEGITGAVHAGFASSVANTWDDVLEVVDSFIGRDGFVFFGGHSKGGAEALLAAKRYSDGGRFNVGAVHVFGTPAVGGREFSEGYERTIGDRTFRHVHRSDWVARSPAVLRVLGIYRHVGRVVYHVGDGRRTFRPHPLRLFLDGVRALSRRRGIDDHGVLHYVRGAAA